MVGKDSTKSKEYFPKRLGHPVAVPEKKSINVVVAENITFWMNERGWTEPVLAKKATVDQKTVWNFLNPEKRLGEDAKKPPSGTLTSLEKIAAALDVAPSQLTRDSAEAPLYAVIEDAVRRAMALQPQPGQDGPPTPTATKDQHRRAAESKLQPGEKGHDTDRKAS